MEEARPRRLRRGTEAFRLRGQTATLAGRQDLITVWKDDALITDVKAGREQPWHKVQIMIYMYALPRALPQYLDSGLRGEIVYPTRTVKVPRGSCHCQFIRDLGALIRRLADDTPATRVPSPQECRFGDIAAYECDERIDDGTHPEDETTEDF